MKNSDEIYGVMIRKKKRILYIVSCDLDRRGADIVNIMEMCNAFSKQELNIALMVPEYHENNTDLFKYYGISFPFKIIPIRTPKLFRRKIIPGLSMLFSICAIPVIKKLNFDLIYTRTPWIFFIVSVVCRQPCFFEAHQFRYQGVLTQFVYRILVKMGSRKTKNCIVCISKTLMKQWQQYSNDFSSCYVAHDGVNIEKFNKIVSKKHARRQLGLNLKKPIVVYTGSLLPGKGVDVLIRAANRLPSIQFIIAGGDKNQIDKLIKLSNQDNILFLGHIPLKKIPIYQSAADILALPNTRGSVIDDVTSPIKLFEYFASRRPIVSSDISSLLEILHHMDNALISPAGNDLKLAENIQLLINNPMLGEQLAKNASSNIKKYTWEARVAYLQTLFNTV